MAITHYIVSIYPHAYLLSEAGGKKLKEPFALITDATVNYFLEGTKMVSNALGYEAKKVIEVDVDVPEEMIAIFPDREYAIAFVSRNGWLIALVDEDGNFYSNIAILQSLPVESVIKIAEGLSEFAKKIDEYYVNYFLEAINVSPEISSLAVRVDVSFPNNKAEFEKMLKKVISKPVKNLKKVVERFEKELQNVKTSIEIERKNIEMIQSEYREILLKVEKENTELYEENKKLKEENERLRKRVEELEALLQSAENRNNGSELPNVDEMIDGLLGGDVEEIEKADKTMTFDDVIDDIVEGGDEGESKEGQEGEDEFVTDDGGGDNDPEPPIFVAD